MKKVGTIKEVYLNLAQKTENGLTKKDIINIKKLKVNNSKKIILSKKNTTNNEFNNPLIRYKQNRFSKKQTKNKKGKIKTKEQNIHIKKQLEKERKQERKNRRIKKSIRNKKKENNKLSKKIFFNMNNNITKEYECKNIDGYESDNEFEYNSDAIQNSHEFKIEEMPEIDLSNYI